MTSLTNDQFKTLIEKFPTIGADGSGYLWRKDVQASLKLLGIEVPTFKVNNLLELNVGFAMKVEMKTFLEFLGIFEAEKNSVGIQWKSQISKATGIYRVMSETQETVIHTIRYNEEMAVMNFINHRLEGDADVKDFLPINQGELYLKMQDGIIICKLLNQVVPKTIDEKAINKTNLNHYKKLENLTLALLSAQAIGCNIMNIGCADLLAGTPHLVLGLLWQIVKIGLFDTIDFHHCPGLYRLLLVNETLDDLCRLPREEILIRWINLQMVHAGISRRIQNLTSDISDSEIYSHLLFEIAPSGCGVTMDPLRVEGNIQRAAAMLAEAEKMGCREFITPADVVSGNYQLNLAFIANLFKKFNNLQEQDVENHHEETREELVLRNWCNSIGFDKVKCLYNDLRSGIIILQLFDIIEPGIVDWKKVTRDTCHKFRGCMHRIENCNYAVELAKSLNFSVVGIQGSDIAYGNRKLTLAVLWQLLRAYTLSVLAQCSSKRTTYQSDKDIVLWVNEKFACAEKNISISSFNDPTISDSLAILTLIDVIKKDVVDWKQVAMDGSHKSKLENASYAITCSRKIGAKVYALPEDIVEVNSKMILTIFACLMARDLVQDAEETAHPVNLMAHHD